ncbi:hypothetical protein HDE_09585 [Halotydeus destructor]|nr:hypothetical protein HDE_09585 [Halotydeus destructor]
MSDIDDLFLRFQSLPKGTNSKQSGTLAQPVKKGRVEENIKVAESKTRGEPFKSPRAGFKNGEHSRSQKRSFNDQRRNSETSPKQGSHFERRRDDDRRERRDRDRSRSSGGGGISAQNGLPKINCLPESGIHQLDQFPDAQIKHWDYGYRTPEGLARLEQLEALVAEDQLNAPEPDLPIDRIWRKDNQDENSTYASYRKTRVDPGAFGSYDPLGLGSEDGGAQFEPTIKVEQPTPVKSTGCADSSQQLSELEQKRRIDEEYERLKREPKKEAAVSRVEAREQERRERAQRETREFRRTMIDKKVIDESRKLRKELKDYDIVGSILMPQTARRLQSRPVEDDVIDETNYYCRTCHVRSIGREERDRHDDSDEHKAEVRRLENLEVDRRIEADKKYNEQVKRGQLPETRTPAEIFDHKPIRPPSPRTPPEYNNGAPSPCHSNAPSVESDDDLPPPVPKPEPFRPPSDGMAKVIYLLDQKETLTVDAILNVNSLQIASEKEAQVAKELLRLLDGSMFAFADKLIPNDVRDMMQEKGLLRSKTS